MENKKNKEITEKVKTFVLTMIFGIIIGFVLCICGPITAKDLQELSEVEKENQMQYERIMEQLEIYLQQETKKKAK